jgi:hypothetical protein
MEQIARGAHQSTHPAAASHGQSSDAFDRALPLLYQILGIDAPAGSQS